MNDRIFVATLHACHLFVPQTHWREALFDGGVFKGDAPLLAEVFGTLHRAGIETGNLSILGLIEHGHLCPASPTPEYLHASILYSALQPTSPLRAWETRQMPEHAMKTGRLACICV